MSDSPRSYDLSAAQSLSRRGLTAPGLGALPPGAAPVQPFPRYTQLPPTLARQEPDAVGEPSLAWSLRISRVRRLLAGFRGPPRR
jgi:hypothetical protein